MPNKFINGKKKFKKNKVRELDSMMSHIISTFDYLYENSSKSLSSFLSIVRTKFEFKALVVPATPP